MQRALLLIATLTTACPDQGLSGALDGATDAGGAADAARADASPRDAAGADAQVNEDAAPSSDASAADIGADASPADASARSCLDQGHTAGERYLADDQCNFCDCLADGTTACTTRTCTVFAAPCTYDNVAHGYGERFPSTDGCNECTCAVSGLACTRRSCPGGQEEGAILLETDTATCGLAGFTPRAVLDQLPYTRVRAPFLYERTRALYPEVLPDSMVDVRVVYDGGFLACRIPSPGQEALDVEVIVEWRTADGAFDEGFRGYLRKNAGGFVDAWWIAAGAPFGGLGGSYGNPCLDPGGFSFDAQIERDGTSFGSITRVCETDIALTVGAWRYAN